VLAVQPAALVITDLMMPGRSGFDLVATLDAAPELCGSARVVVFSAGLTPEVRTRLAGTGVWRLLSKPCSVVELEACVRDAITPAPSSSAAAVQAPSPERELAGQDEQAAAQAVAQAITQHFGGNHALYQAFRASCLLQFAADAQAGDLACAAHDGPALHRLAHSLKSVLLTLGHDEASALARRLEDLAAHAQWDQALPLWPPLRDALARLK
jgi:CheY-like chemotaxis protein